MKKTAIITGASGNLGKAAVLKFLKEGYKIIATVSPGKTLGYEADGEIIVEQVDLLNESDVNAFVNKYSVQENSIDAALLLVGGFAMGNISNTDGAAMNKMIALNFFTAFYMARPILAKMQSQKGNGRIILVGSRPGLYPKEGKNALAYGVSKAMIFNFADLLNAESNSKKVVTNVIVPGTIDTQQNRNAMPNANFDHWVSPEEIVDNIYWLCTEQASSLRNTRLEIYGDQPL